MPKPLVIAHRGASGVLPEHTIQAYALAIAQGADFIEPDLVATKDGVLIARHEPMLSTTTDVANRSNFAGRSTTRSVDGAEVTDWFAGDFTLDEIRQLRVRQSFPGRDTRFDGLYRIPTLGEVIALVAEEARRNGRSVGIYPELKHPLHHARLGLALEPRLLAALAGEGWTEATSPVIVQCFEPETLRNLRARTNVRLMQLIGAPHEQPYDFAAAGDGRHYRDLLSVQGLKEIRTYADGIGPPKSMILPPRTLIAEAHASDLFVHAWTFRNEPHCVAAQFAGDALAEYRAAYAAGLDGVFSDFPDFAVKARGN